MHDKTYHVYILKCADDSYYTGVTNNVNIRFAQHNSGLNPECYTYPRRPVQLVFAYEFRYVTNAIAFEKQVKGWSRKKKEAIIGGNWETLRELAECMNKTTWKRER